MANVDGGALSFKSILDNDQMNAAIEETMRRVTGLSDATVAGGKRMDSAFLRTADGIRQALGQIGQACEMHEAALMSLGEQYERLGKETSEALSSGDASAVRAIQERKEAIRGEIAVRQKALAEARNLSDELEKEAQKREQSTKQIEANAQAHQSLRGQIRALKEEMAQLVAQGIDEQSEAYKALVNELGRLQDIQGDIAQQGRILANDEAKFQGFIQGLSGLSGAFSAATGAVSLFAGENENLQRVMTKVQSVMAIAMGMQSLAQTLNKDSAFRLVTLNGLKEWWAGIVAKSTAAEVAETTATVANTAAHQAQTAATVQGTVAQGANAVAQGAQTTAATAGTVANLTLAGAFRAVGLAIKSIPVFGWLIAGLSAIVTIATHFANKADEARKAQEEFTKAMIDGAYKPIGKLEELSSKYTALGNNIKEKEQFIKDNRKAFDDLGVAVNSVRDAENLLIDNKDAFISAQIAKAKAMLYTQQATEKIKKQMELQAEYEKMPDRVTVAMTGGSAMGGYTTSTLNNTIKEKKRKEIEDLQKEIREDFKRAAEEEANEYNKLKNAGIKSAGTYAQGTVGAIEKAIAEKQEALKHLKPNTAEFKKANKEIEDLQKQIEKPTRKHAGSSKKEKDPFLEQLDKRKTEYERYKKWLNSGDDVLIKSASIEFKGLIAQGETYVDYLKKQRDEILSIDAGERTKEQNKNLRALNDRISEETKKTVLEAFNDELSKQLGNAKTTLEMLNIIAQKRKELADDDTELGDEKKSALDDAEVSAVQRQQEETKKLLEDHASYLDKKIQLDLQYSNDLALLEKARAKATTDEERAKIDAAKANRKARFDTDYNTLGSADYAQMLRSYQSFEQKRLDIADSYEQKRKIAAEALAIFEHDLTNATTEEERKAALQRIEANKEMLREMNRQESRDNLNLKFEQLKMSPEYIRAFEDLDFASTETLKHLIAKFEEVKNSVGENLNPEDLKQYVDAVQNMVDELNARAPFAVLTQAFNAQKMAMQELKSAQADLNAVRAKGQQGSEEEARALARVNKAKDNLNKANAQVRKSEKEVQRQVNQLCQSLKEVGEAVGGQAGRIISLIGDIGTFVTSTIDSVKSVASTGAQAISAIEKASVILAVISAAYQIATKIVSMFSGDDGTEAYEAAQKVYQSYTDTLHKVIDAELELMETMSGKDAQGKYEHAISLINKTADAARELGKQYLNAGASKGVLGIGSKASHGVSQRKDMSKKAWDEAREVAKAYDIDWSRISDGRMTGLFDLSTKQLKALRDNAPLFFSQLHSDTRKYIQDIIAADDAAQEAANRANETLVGLSFDAMRNDFLSALQEMELDAKNISKNIQEYMRKALINDMFKKNYQGELQKYYDAFAAAMKEDSEGGSLITDKEKAGLDSIRERIVSGAVAAAEEINKQFKDTTDAAGDTSLTGAVKGVSEETASIVAGQLNAMRINQVEASAILRQQLTALNAIVQNTSYNRMLVEIHKELRAMNGSADPLRSQGLA